MHVRPLAIAIGVSVALVAGAFLLLGSRPRVDPIVPIAIADLPTASGPRLRMVPQRPAPAPPGSFAQAQPCLIATLNCLELAPEPFAPCLLAVERCSGEWRLQPLLGRHAEPEPLGSARANGVGERVEQLAAYPYELVQGLLLGRELLR